MWKLRLIYNLQTATGCIQWCLQLYIIKTSNCTATVSKDSKCCSSAHHLYVCFMLMANAIFKKDATPASFLLSHLSCPRKKNKNKTQVKAKVCWLAFVNITLESTSHKLVTSFIRPAAYLELVSQRLLMNAVWCCIFVPVLSLCSFLEGSPPSLHVPGWRKYFWRLDISKCSVLPQFCVCKITRSDFCFCISLNFHFTWKLISQIFCTAVQISPWWWNVKEMFFNYIMTYALPFSSFSSIYMTMLCPFIYHLKHGINPGVKSLPRHGCATLCDTVLMISHPTLVYGSSSQSCSVNTLSC